MAWNPTKGETALKCGRGKGKLTRGVGRRVCKPK